MVWKDIFNWATEKLMIAEGHGRTNEFWVDGKLIGQSYLEEKISSLVRELDIESEDKPHVKGVYLCGKLYRLKDKKVYYHGPKSVDLYFWTDNYLDNWFTTSIKNSFENDNSNGQIKRIWGLPYNLVGVLPIEPWQNDLVGNYHKIYENPLIKRRLMMEFLDGLSNKVKSGNRLSSNDVKDVQFIRKNHPDVWNDYQHLAKAIFQVK